MVCLDHPVFRADGGAFNQRQQVALHTLARHVGAAALAGSGDLVYFVNEDDAVLFGVFHGLAADVFFVDEFGGFFVGELAQGIGHLQAAGFAFVLLQVAEHGA